MKRLLFFLFFLCGVSVFAQEGITKKEILDIQLLIYPNSVFQVSIGKNPSVFGYKEYETLNSKAFDLETRFSIRDWQTKYLTFAVSGLFGFINGEDTSVLKSSLGCGINYKFAQEEQIFSGLYIFLYPIYGFPLIPFNKKLITDWRIALDLGFSVSILGYLDFNFYLRNNFAWYSNKYKIIPDLGFAIGLTIPGDLFN